MRGMKRSILLLMLLPAAIVLSSVNAFSAAVVCGYAEDLLAGINAPGSEVSETALGDAAADAARYISGADAAIIPGGDIRANLRGGDVTETMLEAVFPEGKTLVLLHVTEAELRELLEYGVSHTVYSEPEILDVERSSWAYFPQVSGLSFSYDISAPVGGRVSGLEAGFDADGTLALVTTQEMLTAAGNTAAGAEVCSEREALARYFEEQSPIRVPDGGRIRLLGVASLGITAHIPRVLIILLAAFLVIIPLWMKGSLSIRAGTADGVPKGRRDIDED